jgi:REP-associated tyrosine transposase
MEEGRHLWRCLCYIELNMVRARVVSHPREWEWVGYHEIMGERKRESEVPYGKETGPKSAP